MYVHDREFVIRMLMETAIQIHIQISFNCV